MFTKVLMDVGVGEAPTYLFSKHLFLNILSKLPPLCSYFFQFRLFSVEISRAVPSSPPPLAIIQFSNPDTTQSQSHSLSSPVQPNYLLFSLIDQYFTQNNFSSSYMHRYKCVYRIKRTPTFPEKFFMYSWIVFISNIHI